MATLTVALWYLRYGAAGYDLFENEELAAGVAVAMVEDCQVYVTGVQYADGRVVPVSEWKAYRVAEQRSMEPMIAATPRVPVRQVRDPFGAGMVNIWEAAEPGWLGVPDRG